MKNLWFALLLLVSCSTQEMQGTIIEKRKIGDRFTIKVKTQQGNIRLEVNEHDYRKAKNAQSIKFRV